MAGMREEIMKSFKSDGRLIMVTVAAALLLIACGLAVPGWASAADEAVIDKILAGVEKRYNVPGFTADFDQESILKAMEVTDTAAGRLMVRQPGKMRWEYLVPDPQTIITDGNDLWVYRPEENQVLVGKAPALFGEGKGAGFLSNIKMVRESFQISLMPDAAPGQYRLKLVPNRSTVDLMEVELNLDRKTFNLVEIATFNVYGDETRIRLSNIDFSDPPDEKLFRFEVPEGAEVLQMNP
ncbi:outer-membrane lipoprotein carrier protein [Desulfosarcina widdelii]|uniref:Outer-membrane lipoprotein carrier protein n=2 Tax=Desulfosarcina widdelii TaxID=947919 RepID=A0A5K7Z6D5_9BACT|nr:outer-membrane lipoprotein carrier protein [Desulfosarcina widdelii]